MMMYGKMKTFDEKLAAAVPLSPIVCDRCWVTDIRVTPNQKKLTPLSLLLHTHSANNNTHTQKVVLVAMNNSCPRPNFLSSTQHSRQAALYTFIVLFFSL